jgi:hypothetical protein
MSLEHSTGRQRTPVFEPSYTVDEFCAAERMSRSMIYKAWQEGWGPRFYLNGVSRRITHEARLEWQRQREQAARVGAHHHGTHLSTEPSP